MKFTPTALPTHKEEKLSLEAGRVIGNFQDLAFLRAKYLVFPIKGDTEWRWKNISVFALSFNPQFDELFHCQIRYWLIVTQVPILI